MKELKENLKNETKTVEKEPETVVNEKVEDASVSETKTEKKSEPVENKDVKTTVKKSKKTTTKKVVEKKDLKVSLILQVAGKSVNASDVANNIIDLNKEAKDIKLYFNLDENKVYPVIDGAPSEGFQI